MHYLYTMLIEISPEIIKQVKQWWENTKAQLAIPYIDSQHIWLVTLLYKGQETLQEKDPQKFQQDFSQILRYLTLYAERHFKAEEALLNYYSYPKTEEHRHRHQGFVNSLAKLQKRQFSIESAQTLLHFLTEWISLHIEKEDHQYATFLARRRANLKEFFEKFTSHEENHLCAEEKFLYEKIRTQYDYEADQFIKDKIKETYSHLHLQTRIPIIDIQHLWILKLLTQFEFLLLQKKAENSDLILNMLKKIFQYIQEHFQAEESFMNRLHYNQLKIHHQKHVDFLKKMEYKYKARLSDLDKLAPQVLKEIKEWFFNHVVSEDRLLGNYVSQKPQVAMIIAKKLMAENEIIISPAQIALYKEITANLK